MHSFFSKTAIATTLSFVLAAPAALAQQTSGGMMGGLKMPYERDFWGHVGLSLGRTDLDAACPAGGNCDYVDQGMRIFGGGRFNNAIGGEIGYVNFGDFTHGAGEVDAHAIDAAFVAGIPFGNNWSVFGKLGLAYNTAEVRSTLAGVQTGKASGWGPRFGFGVQMGINENWAIRADLDRYRVKLPAGRDSIDTFMLGAQYTFR